VRLWVIAMAACNASTPPPVEPVPYDGVTTCGAAVLPPPHRQPPLPEREPVPSFVAPRSAMPDIQGDMSSDVVDRPIRANSTRFLACYMHSEQAPGIRVTAHFTILEDGTVAGVEIHGVAEIMDRCICDTVASIRFPVIGERTTVTYPLVFD